MNKEVSERINRHERTALGSNWRVIVFIYLVFLLISCTNEKGKLFVKVPEEHSGIQFVNTIIEDNVLNVYNYPHIYYGAGVAACDINKDGLPDLYFAGNQVKGKLYLNLGNLKFKDITETAGLTDNFWGMGVNFADVNQDGWSDLYISVSGPEDGKKRANRLYINNGDLTFVESSEEYGLSETRPVIQTVFLDYDKDQDLDVFMLVNPSDYDSNRVNDIRKKKDKGQASSTDVLYRNNGDGTYTDVSEEAGILIEGYGLGVAVSDINNDGWPDIYISNDFLTNDVLYINQRNGTFKNEAGSYLAHTSFAGMGTDIADINNDGLVDIIELDMLPEDNYRQKMIVQGNNYQKFNMMIDWGYEPQYSRNTLQINNGDGTFSEIGFMAGVSGTDWSWAPLLADYDNDGDRDLYITNGYAKDMGNMDFINYALASITSFGTESSRLKKYLTAVADLNPVAISNYMYENTNGILFENETVNWGLDEESVSSGALYSDLDNDGDLDLVVNNIDQKAFIYENNAENKATRYIKISLEGSEKNKEGIGTKITIKNGRGIQFYEHYPSRGYMSSVDHFIHFGLGGENKIDTLKIEWPDGKYQELTAIGTDQRITLDHKEANSTLPRNTLLKNRSTLFEQVESNISYLHKENNRSDFDIQPLLPHMHSANGPGISVGDINNDSYEDFYIGGAAGITGSIFLQKPDGNFEEIKFNQDISSEDMGSLLFDADNDGDLDLYIASGGTAYVAGNIRYKDRIYKNNGKGNFTLIDDVLPDINASSSCVVGADYDKDGDMDLFVGARIEPGMYPITPRSSLLRNDTYCGDIQFTGISSELDRIGMVSAALWTDFDNDGWVDLIVAGEFMPITLFKNNHGVLEKVKEPANGLANTNGWWNSICAGDFDMDGDTDYLLGNLGLNSRYTASITAPLCVYAKDFDQNGEIDPILTRYIEGKRYISHSRDDLTKQINSFRNRFNNYHEYAEASFEDSFLKEELADAQVLKSEVFSHTYVENKGNGRFETRALPLETQISPIYGMLVDDYDKDGYLDVLVTGNSYSTEVSTGHYDAMGGLYLKGDGKGHFEVQKARESGFLRPGNARGLVKIYIQNYTYILSVGNNSDLKTFLYKSKPYRIKVKPSDAYALMTTTSGVTFKTELYYGNTYLSSGSRELHVPVDVTRLVIVDFKGNKREVP